MLKATLNAYHNRAIATHEVIEELIKLAKEMEAARKRGQDLGLNDDEIAFYDALAVNESAVKAMGNAELKVIAAELVTRVRKSVTIDWAVREGARAKIKVLVKLLRGERSPRFVPRATVRKRSIAAENQEVMTPLNESIALSICARDSVTSWARRSSRPCSSAP